MRLAFLYGGAATLLLAIACSGSHAVVGYGPGSGGGAGSAGSGAVGGTISGAAGSAAGTSPTAGQGGSGGIVAIPPLGPQMTSGKLDLLFAIDNSTSMADKQALLVATLPSLLQRLANPYCVSAQPGGPSAQPLSPTDPCPAGTQREFAPIRDMHIGVITSSLGSHGGDVCNNAVNPDDLGQLVPSVRTGLSSYNDEGYLSWDPDAHASPPGESNLDNLTLQLTQEVEAAGQSGCGFEAQLESVYRFLVDPSPPQQVVQANGATVAQGINTTLLQQRAHFLRPDSSVAVVMLTDEDDCSIADQGFAWFVATRIISSGSENRMFRPTSACATDPGSPCCMSCADTSVPASGCTAPAADPSCQQDSYLTAADDSIALRCWDQKRRFGFEVLWPLSRYVNGFAGAQVPDQNGSLVDNPLFHQNGVTRAPSLFTFSLIAGVPWQDLATSTSSAATLDYLPADQLATRWPAIAGDPTSFVNPSDPFMVSTTADRTTLPIAQNNPFSSNSLVSASSTNPQANAINGHEQNIVLLDDLQYACIMPLAQPRLCDQTNTLACDCSPGSSLATINSPLCNPAGTSTQTYAKGYPALRELWVASQLGPRSVVGSVCARNTTNPAAADYGYNPSFGAIGRRVAATLAPGP